MEADADAEDGDPAVLSSSTLAILNSFLEEQKKAREESSKDPFAEDWGMSQFWYTDETAERLADEVNRAAQGGTIACLACPSLFRKLKQKHPSAKTHLFEYDTRFDVLQNFHVWDYNAPHELPRELLGTFKVLIIDPPYLSAECLSKSMKAMTLLADDSASPIFLALTGAAVSKTAKDELNLRAVTWRPEHKSKLGNDFCFFTRDSKIAERFGGWDTDLA